MNPSRENLYTFDVTLDQGFRESSSPFEDVREPRSILQAQKNAEASLAHIGIDKNDGGVGGSGHRG